MPQLYLTELQDSFHYNEAGSQENALSVCFQCFVVKKFYSCPVYFMSNHRNLMIDEIRRMRSHLASRDVQ